MSGVGAEKIAIYYHQFFYLQEPQRLKSNENIISSSIVIYLHTYSSKPDSLIVNLGLPLQTSHAVSYTYLGYIAWNRSTH